VHCPPENSPAVAAELTRVFSFTPREAAVAMALMSGKSLEGIASDLGVRLATAKSHLNALFEKTRTSRQADLVQCLLRALPPTFF
jgi:DNA-binding CsgD family transcriptional regulator